MQTNINLEVCVDNIESIISAGKVGVDRLELCSALAVGGITPSSGLVKYAKKNANISLHAMIRTRGGDFCFSREEKRAMKYDISSLADLGVDGIVIGFLDHDFNIDLKVTDEFVTLAKKLNLSVTFHRAIDFVKNYNSSIESLIDIGIDRVLTSGQSDKAFCGLDKIAEANMKFGQRIEIMAGSGINSGNVSEIIQKTDVKNIHCSASILVNKFPDKQLSLGSSSSSLEYSVVNENELKLIKERLSV